MKYGLMLNTIEEFFVLLKNKSKEKEKKELKERERKRKTTGKTESQKEYSYELVLRFLLFSPFLYKVKAFFFSSEKIKQITEGHNHYQQKQLQNPSA